MSELSTLIIKIEQLHQRVESYRPISPEQETRIMQKFRLDWNYHSNSIEGNQLTFGETKTFLLHGITAKGKPLKDHLDIKGHNEAILLLEDIVKSERPLTETFIRELHQIILHEPYQNPAITPAGLPTTRRIEIGKYKTQPNHVKTVTGEIFYFATPEETPAKMNDLMDWYQQSIIDPSMHPLITASLFHYRFIRVHPFDDGNGRMARILMNLIFMLKGFPPVIIKKEQKEDYFSALQQADGGDETAFVLYIGEQLAHSLEIFLKGAKGESIEEPDDVDKEIMLLKAELAAEEEKVELNEKTLIHIKNTLIIPLIEKVVTKLEKFNEMFFYSEFWYSYTDASAFVPLNKQILIENILNKNKYKNLFFRFNWREFKKTKNINFNSTIDLALKFEQYNFIIISESKAFEPLIIYYHQPTPEEEYQRIANTMAKNVLEYIKSQIHKKEE